ncbi:MAG: hypothetical protein ACRYGP_21005 [Janthinobacterium lividum]
MADVEFCERPLVPQEAARSVTFRQLSTLTLRVGLPALLVVMALFGMQFVTG